MSVEFKNIKSIYLQIADNMVERMMNGTHPPGEKIPSVREFAAEMGVNPNTILRTYNDLQMRQIIENKRGIGYYVTPDAQDKILSWKKDEFFANELPGIIKQMTMLGITYSDLKPFFDIATQNNTYEDRK
jgi:DNA-binding transcriptional regulator YhcF (GntR family)